MDRFFFIVGIVVAAFAAFFCPPSHAETNGWQTVVFPSWSRTSISSLGDQTPVVFRDSSIGSVTTAYRHLQALEDRPASPGGPKISPRPATPEQVSGLQSNLSKGD